MESQKEFMSSELGIVLAIIIFIVIIVFILYRKRVKSMVNSNFKSVFLGLLTNALYDFLNVYTSIPS
ncbi:hypothetical protein BN1317_30242 [Staphylococcus capitis]|nr:hypothetical protein CR01_170064 [Staphylococcus capitis CR01]CQD26511.1 hypothetical protein SCAPIOD120064 [Staphylococcus capitis]CQD31142.1 hypothetical protein SCAPIOD160005 [Staphylococcus capitis]CRN10963.1 hypothetical protein BN1517140007 [Staphylococcus capitis]CUT96033.1 hypothetical protein BN1317_30242 [Staphylococcus capitis]